MPLPQPAAEKIQHAEPASKSSKYGVRVLRLPAVPLRAANRAIRPVLWRGPGKKPLPRRVTLGDPAAHAAAIRALGDDYVRAVIAALTGEPRRNA